MSSNREVKPTAVLKFVDRGSDLILYEPEAATRACQILGLARSVSTWGDLRQLSTSEPKELVEPILEHVWDVWDGGDGASSLGVGDDESDPPGVASVDELLRVFPDERALQIPGLDVNDEPMFMDPFDPECVGVPKELRHFYVDQSTMSSTWWAPSSDDLPKIRAAAELIGWRLEEGTEDDLPYW